MSSVVPEVASPSRASVTSSARRLAYQALLRVERDGAFAERVLSTQLNRPPLLSARDRGFVTELVYGTLRHICRIDGVLGQLATQPLNKLPIEIRVALRLGVYQISYLGTPPYSAVTESVALVPRRFGRLRGVVNGVLRNLARGQQTLHAASLPSPVETCAQVLATAASVPLHLVEELLAQRGRQGTEDWLRATGQRPPLALRVNTRRTTVAALVAALAAHGDYPVEEVPGLPCILLRGAGRVDALPGFSAGHFAVQDPAAVLVSILAGVRPGQTVLDACAAPGGKATHLGELMDNDGVVFATELHGARTRLITQAAQRLGTTSVRPMCLDARDPEALARAVGVVDVALLDAPCSGLGTLRRHPELRRQRGVQCRSQLVVQRALLASVARVVKPGGRLVYAVCTPTRAEGPEQVAAFLAEHPHYALEDPRGVASISAAPIGVEICEEPLLAGQSVIRTWTDKSGWDSFFVALLRRSA